jgi:hypothetical protein
MAPDAADGVIETPTAVLLPGDLGPGVVQGSESIRTFVAGNFVASNTRTTG